MLTINESDLNDAIVNKAVEQILNQDSDLGELIQKEVIKRIDNIFADKAAQKVSELVDEAIKDGLNREYQRVNSWGEPVGERTSIKKSLESIINGYWSEKVNPKTGHKASSDYGSVTRSEYVMSQVCAESFTDQMKVMTLSIAGHMKDGLRSQIASTVDQMLSELFRVKSLQDQGKVEKPW